MTCAGLRRQVYHSSMSLPHQRSVDLLKTFLEGLIRGAAVKSNQDYSQLAVAVGGKTLFLPLGRSQLDDLGEALSNDDLPVTYRNGIKLDAMLSSLVYIGTQGLAIDVDIRKVMLTDLPRDWSLAFSIRPTVFVAETAKNIYEGVTTLNSLAARQLAEAGGSEESLQHDREILDSIKAHYETRGHLNDIEVRGESLQYIKAAIGVCLLALEQRKAKVAAARVKEAQSKKIFEMFGEFWVSHPYNRIPLPQIFRGYMASQHLEPERPQIGPSIDIGPLLRPIDPRLEDRWQGAWESLRSNNPDRVSQAANSMVEVLDKVIGSVCGERQFKQVLAERYPKQQEVIETSRKYIAALKETLHSVKHETNEQKIHTAEDLIHAAEGVIRTLLR
jgi:hypothetical protein